MQVEDLIPTSVRLLQDLLQRIEGKRRTKKGIQPADSRLLLQATKALATLLDAARKHDAEARKKMRDMSFADQLELIVEEFFDHLDKEDKQRVLDALNKRYLLAHGRNCTPKDGYLH